MVLRTLNFVSLSQPQEFREAMERSVPRQRDSVAASMAPILDRIVGLGRSMSNIPGMPKPEQQQPAGSPEMPPELQVAVDSVSK